MAEDPKPPEPAPAEKPAVPEASKPDTAPVAAPAPLPPVAAPVPLPPVAAPVPDTGYTTDGVPTFDGVREKIETRFGTALGATELAEETTEGRTAAQRYEARQKAAADKLDEIRASMHKKD